MPTVPSAMPNSVSRSPATRLPLLLLLLTTLVSKLHLVAKRKSSMTVLRISTELKRNRSKDLKNNQLTKTIAQLKDALELPRTISPQLNDNRNVIRKSAQPNNREKRSTNRSRLRNKESLMRKSLLRRRFVRSKKRPSSKRKSVSSRTLCS